MNLHQDIFYWGIVFFAIICLLLFVPFGRHIDWSKNYRQQKNIALYQQQMSFQPENELANEFSQRLLADEQALQPQTMMINNVRPFSKIWAGLLCLTLFAVPLAYYFSLNRIDYIQQGEQAFKQKQHQMRTAMTEQKNDDYILSIQNKLREDPNDYELWLELGQAYALNSEFDYSLIAYANAEKIAGSRPEILGLAATALYYQAGQKITARVDWLIDQALQQDANEISSLSLRASDAFLNADYATALKYWQKLLDTDRSEVDRRKTIESMQLAERLFNNSLNQQ